MNYIGIDPGKDGAFVVIDENKTVIAVHLMPMIGKEYDKLKMMEIIGSYEVQHAVLEDVHAPQMAGRTSCFEFGRGKGLLEMMLYALKIPHTQVQAKAWQKEVWEGVKKQYKSGIKPAIDTKLTSILAAKSLFPSQDLTKSARAHEPHTGIVDALLMAEFCRRKFR